MIQRPIHILLPLCFLVSLAAFGQDALPPKKVLVLPVFYVPSDQEAPTDAQSEKLMKHLRWTQRRYAELLPGGITFDIASDQPHVYRSARTLDDYQNEPDSTASRFVGNLLDAYGFTRYTCPYIFFIVVISPDVDFPVGGGRPFNGGYNTGGGLVHISSFVLDRVPNVQSTTEHEIGHAIGLPHVDVYGYDMARNVSMMSYNLDHRTRFFEPGPDPAVFIPEDIRGFAMNSLVLPGLTFDPERDIPSDYSIASRIIHLGPMDITGHPKGVHVTTSSGETWESSVSNVVQGRIEPSEKTGTITYSGRRMWTSAETGTGWVSLELTMPYEVELTAVRVHTEHSGLYHRATAGRVSVRSADGSYISLAERDFLSNDETIRFDPVAGRLWKIGLQAGESRMVVVRGLQFYAGGTEVYPPLVPVPQKEIDN